MTRGAPAQSAWTASPLPLLEAALPKYVTTTEKLGRAMIYAAAHEAPKSILETPDIDQLAKQDAASRANLT